VPVNRVREWEAGFVRFLKSERPGVLADIDKQKALDDNLLARLNAAISTFNHQFGIEGYQDQPDPASQPAAAQKAT
jgi:F0F1-type ATP synthase alpha subunit